jgi:lysozyme
MKTSAVGRAFIEAFEGLSLKAYWDATGKVWTIGYGHTSAAGPPRVYAGMIITQSEADQILSADLNSVEIEVSHLVKVPLKQYQADALNSFQFNTGWLAHLGCSLLRALNVGNYKLADADFALYDESGGRVLTGLVRRRKGEAEMFAGNIKQALLTAGAKIAA